MPTKEETAANVARLRAEAARKRELEQKAKLSGLSTKNGVYNQTRGQDLYAQSVNQYTQANPTDSAPYQNFQQQRADLDELNQLKAQAKEINKNIPRVQVPEGGFQSIEDQLRAEKAALQGQLDFSIANLNRTSQKFGTGLDDMNRQKVSDFATTQAKKRINPEYQGLTQQQKAMNKLLPESQQVQQYIMEKSGRAGIDQGIGAENTQKINEFNANARRRAIAAGLDPEEFMYKSPTQKNFEQVRAEQAANATINEQNVKTVQTQTEKVMAALNIPEDTPIEIDENGDIKIIENGESIDPVERAKMKFEEKTAQEVADARAEFEKSKGLIENAHRMNDGTITVQGREKMAELERDFDKKIESYEESRQEQKNNLVLSEYNRQESVQASFASSNDPVKQQQQQMALEKVQGTNNIRREYANKGQNISLALAAQIWQKRNTYDEQGEAQKEAGVYLDQVLADGEVTAAEFGSLSGDFFNGNIDDSYKAIKSRVGVDMADEIQNQYLESKGMDEFTIKQRKYETGLGNFFRGDDQNAVKFQDFVNKMDKDGMSDEFIAAQLETIINSPSTGYGIKAYASSVLKAYEPEQKEMKFFGNMKDGIMAVDPNTLETKMIKTPTRMSSGANTGGGGGFTSMPFDKDAALSYEQKASSDPEAARKVEAILNSYSGMDIADIPNSQASGFMRSRVAELLSMKQQELAGNGDFIGVMKATAGGKGMSATERKSLGKAKTVINQLNALAYKFEDEFTGADGSTIDISPLTGWIKKRNPWNTDAQEIQAILNATVPNLARGVYGEVGVLTDKDVAIYSQTIPNLNQTADVKKAVMGLTLRTVRNSMKDQLEIMAGDGINVSKLVPTYEAINNQIEDIESSLGINKTQQTAQDIGQATPDQLISIGYDQSDISRLQTLTPEDQRDIITAINSGNTTIEEVRAYLNQ